MFMVSLTHTFKYGLSDFDFCWPSCWTCSALVVRFVCTRQSTGGRVIISVLGLFNSENVLFWQEPVNLFLLTASSPEAAGDTSQIAKDMLAIMFHLSVSFISRLPFVIRFVTPVNKRPMQMWFICIWIDVLSPLTYASNAFWYISK